MSVDDWTVIAPSSKYPAGPSINAIAYDGRWRFVLVGDGTIKTSTDNGVTWTTPTGTITAATLHGVAYGNGLFAAVGVQNGTSSDGGISWSSFKAYLKPGASQGTRLRAIAYGNGLFVAVGDDATILTSSDGNWTSPPVPLPTGVPSSTSFDAITFGNGKFVVGGKSTFIILTSPYGTSWTQATVPVNTALRGVAYGTNGFVGVTASNSLPFLTSTDGSGWTLQAVSGASGLQGIAYGWQTLIVVGNTGLIFRSSNGGTSWTNKTVGYSLNAVAYGTNRFVAVGNAGTIVQSGEVFRKGGSWTVRLWEWLLRHWPF